MNTLGKIITYGTIILTLGTLGMTGFVASEYADYPMPFTKSTKTGRTKNSISAVIGGTVAKQLYQESDINLEIQKTFWPDAHVTGYTTKETIATGVKDLTFTSVNYNAEEKSQGNLEGTVKKSEFDWDVKQTASDNYRIHRLLFKFNSDLQLKAEDGKITGTYYRHGPKFNWIINGNYDNNGNVKIHVNVPLGMDFDLEGKITQKSTQ